MTELQDSTLFDAVQHSWVPVESYSESGIMSVSFEMDLDQYAIERSHFTFLDLLSNIGGLESIFISVMGLIVSTWNW